MTQSMSSGKNIPVKNVPLNPIHGGQRSAVGNLEAYESIREESASGQNDGDEATSMGVK